MSGSHLGDPLLDEEWLAAPTRKPRMRLALSALLVGSLCFLGGALVQKHFGASAGSTMGMPTGSGGVPTGMQDGPPSSFPGGTAGPGAASVESENGESTSGSSRTGTASAVIGKVVKITGDAWIVEDLGGKRHEITISSDATVTRESAARSDDVKVGDTVDITGGSTQGPLEATKVTLR